MDLYNRKAENNSFRIPGCEFIDKGVELMRFTISGKNIEVTDGLRSAVTDKLGKLERYFTPETEIIVTMSVEKERQKIEVTIPVKGNIIRSEQVSNDMYVSIDLVEEVIERQLRKYKNKIVEKHQDGGNFRQEFIEKEVEDEEEIKIIRTKHFGIKRKMPAYRWSFWDTTFSYSAMQRPTRSAWFIREKAIPTD